MQGEFLRAVIYMSLFDKSDFAGVESFSVSFFGRAPRPCVTVDIASGLDGRGSVEASGFRRSKIAEGVSIRRDRSSVALEAEV